MDLISMTTTVNGKANASGDSFNAKRKLETAHSFFSFSVSPSLSGSVARKPSNSCRPFETTSNALLPVDSYQKVRRCSATEPPPLTRCYSDGKILKAIGELLTAEEKTDDQYVPNALTPKDCQTSSVHIVPPQSSTLQKKSNSSRAGSSTRCNPFLDDGTWPLSSLGGPTSTFVTKTDNNNMTSPQRSADSRVMFTPPTPNKRVCCQQGFTQNKTDSTAASPCNLAPSLTQTKKRSPIVSDEIHFASASPLDKRVFTSINMNLEGRSSAAAEALSLSSTPSIAVPPRGRVSASKRAYPRNPGNLSLDLSQMDHVNFDLCTTATEALKRRNDQIALCSKLTDFLYIGGAVAAKNKSLLISNGITHVINCAASVAPASFPDDFCYFNMRLRDHSSQDIARHFYSIFDFIERARECGGRIFLHCVKGISRSPTMAIAYLMWYKNISMYGALDFVRQARPIVDPNAGFIFQLTEWEQQHPNGRLKFQHKIVFRLDVAYANPDKIGLCNSSMSAKNPLFVPLPGIGESYFRDPTKDIGEQCLIVACVDYMFVWCGTDVNEDQVEVAESGATILQRYEAFPVKCDTLRQGQEPVAFWNLVSDIL
ncbi:unnamed protein product [Peronospora belbahrii]|uniref:Protein-tyrosine-phosphatase n=1 Tax=Peronospora belbahrii TaxID=622444 RepID=A0AAU9L6H8_9STRA|nr:unnamed protein product [Peronospora belbahrii]CAH0513189.1 unnamed protein product [Peronospora belbahrii]